VPDPAPLDLIYRRDAQQDLDDLFDHIAADRPIAAERFLLEIKRACEGLRWFPFIGVQIDPLDDRVRVLTIRRRAAIQFAVLDGKIHILSVSYRGRDLRRVLTERRP